MPRAPRSGGSGGRIPSFRRSDPASILPRTRQERGHMMTDETDGYGREPAKNPRQDRLKLALRENLKRRKSQARGRSDRDAAPSGDAGASLDDGSGNEAGE